jgi:hypothetical protein
MRNIRELRGELTAIVERMLDYIGPSYNRI